METIHVIYAQKLLHEQTKRATNDNKETCMQLLPPVEPSLFPLSNIVLS